MNDLLSTKEQLKNKEITLPEIVDIYLDTISKKNKTINAFITVDAGLAKSEAERLQKKVDNGTAGSLAGAIVGVKDVICEKDKITSCASGMLANFESVYDATVIEKLKREDAILLGRLNMDEFAMGSSTENSAYGPTKNPHDTERVPGGSSGGSAAAVAAGMCNVSLGSDTGGSIRQPASYCGVVGLKPTYSRVSRYGLVAFASSFDCIGPLGNSIADTASVLQVISGPDAMDNSSAHIPVPDYQTTLEKNPGKIKIGVPEEYFGEGLDDEIRVKIQRYLKDLENKSAELVPIHLPHMKYGIAAYYILATAEASSNLARYDGIRYGHRANFDEVEGELIHEQKALQEQIKIAAGTKKENLVEELSTIDSPLIRLYKKSRTEGFGTEVKRRIMLGTYVLSAGYYDAYYAKAQKIRRLIKQDFDEVFQKVDVIVSPTAPTTAFKLGENQDDPVRMYLNDVYTISANLAGICGISVPAGIHSNGLPIGIQFMADAFNETKILQSGRLIEALNGES